MRSDQRRSGKRARCIRNEVTERRCAACGPQLRESATLSECCALFVQARVRLPRPRQAPLLPRQPQAPQPRRASAAASASAAGGHAPLQGRLWRTHAAAAPTPPKSPQHMPRSDQPYLHPATHPRPPVSQAQPHARPPSGLGKSAPKTGSGTVADNPLRFSRHNRRQAWRTLSGSTPRFWAWRSRFQPPQRLARTPSTRCLTSTLASCAARLTSSGEWQHVVISRLRTQDAPRAGPRSAMLDAACNHAAAHTRAPRRGGGCAPRAASGCLESGHLSSAGQQTPAGAARVRRSARGSTRRLTRRVAACAAAEQLKGARRTRCCARLRARLRSRRERMPVRSPTRLRCGGHLDSELVALFADVTSPRVRRRPCSRGCFGRRSRGGVSRGASGTRSCCRCTGAR